MRMLHEELVKKSSATLLRSDNDKVWQRSYWSSSHSPKMPGNVRFFAASLHNSRFVLQARTYYKPEEEGTGFDPLAGSSENLMKRSRRLFGRESSVSQLAA